MVMLLVWFVIIVILLSFAYYVVTTLVPAPAQKYFLIALAFLGVLCVIWILLAATGAAPSFMTVPGHPILR